MAHNNGRVPRKTRTKGMQEAAAEFVGEQPVAPIGNLPLHGAHRRGTRRVSCPTARRGRRNPKAARTSSWSATTSRPATSRTAIPELVAGVNAQRARPGAAGRHRLGQDLHHGQDHRGDPAPGPDPGAQQDPGGAALQRVQDTSSRKTRSSISSAITTTTSRKPISRAPTPISRRIPR